MQLLLTCHRDPFSKVGGSEKVIAEMSLRLAKRGHDVTVVTKKSDVPFSHALISGVRVLPWEPSGKGPYKRNKELAHFLGSMGWDVTLLYGQNVWVTDEVWRDVGKFQSSTIYFPVGFPGLGTDWTKLLYFHVVQKHLIENSDVVAALTDREMEQINHLGRAKHIVKIPNGVNAAQFRGWTDSSVRDRYELPDGPLILNIGGDYPNKRLVDACEAVRKLNEFTPMLKATLILIGPGTKDFEKYASTRYNYCVRGLGIINEPDKVALYREARLLLQTSDFEGFGLALLEALAAGIPFVSTDVGVASELAAQGGGRLIYGRPPRDEDFQLGASYHLWQEFETDREPVELQAIAEKYDWEKVVSMLELVIE